MFCCNVYFGAIYALPGNTLDCKKSARVNEFTFSMSECWWPTLKSSLFLKGESTSSVFFLIPLGALRKICVEYNWSHLPITPGSICYHNLALHSLLSWRPNSFYDALTTLKLPSGNTSSQTQSILASSNLQQILEICQAGKVIPATSEQVT